MEAAAAAKFKQPKHDRKRLARYADPQRENSNCGRQSDALYGSDIKKKWPCAVRQNLVINNDGVTVRVIYVVDCADQDVLAEIQKLQVVRNGDTSHWRDCHSAAPPSILSGVSIRMEREPNDSLANG